MVGVDADSAASAEIGEDALRGALDALAAAIEADRVIVLCGIEAEHVRLGRRCGRDLRDDERDDLCRRAIDDALEAGRCVHVRRELDRTGEVAELGITGAMAAPLGGGGSGVLYADFRQRSHHPTDPVAEMLIAGLVVLNHNGRATMARSAASIFEWCRSIEGS